MKKIYLLLINAILFWGATSRAQTTVVLPASQDNTIYSEVPGNSNGAGQDFTAGLTQGGGIRRGLIRFDLSSIPAGAIITAASLRLVLNRTVSGATDMSIYKMSAAWGEGASEAIGTGSGTGVPAQINDATWTCSFSNGAGGCITSWTTSGGDFQASSSATTAVAALGAYTWSSTQAIADIQQWINNASTNFGWILRSDEVVNGSAKRFAAKTNAIVADRPTLTVTYTATVPLTLISFTANAQNYGSLLRWQTAQETNNDFFEIEHSTDALHFDVIGKIDGAGNSSRPINYQFQHQSAEAGRHFYRISQTDFGGAKTYSSIKQTDIKQKTLALLISPNPVSEIVSMPGLELAPGLAYLILGFDGRVIAKGSLTDRQIILPKNIPGGVYQLRINSPSGWEKAGNFIKY